MAVFSVGPMRGVFFETSAIFILPDSDLALSLSMVTTAVMEIAR
jgi:hypothetical protein